jgi:hypothetical protein
MAIRVVPEAVLDEKPLISIADATEKDPQEMGALFLESDGSVRDTRAEVNE